MIIVNILLIVLSIILIIVIIGCSIGYYEIACSSEVDFSSQLEHWYSHFSWTSGYHTKLKGYAIPPPPPPLYEEKDEVPVIDATIAIVAAAYNVEECLSVNIERLLSIGGKFKDFHLYLYENNSTDRTVEILQSYHDSDPEHIHICLDSQTWTEKERKGQSRLAKMQMVRHRSQQFMLRTQQQPADLVLLYDIDLIGGIHPSSIPQIMKSWENSTWDALFANGLSYKHSWGPKAFCLWLFNLPLRDYDSLAYEGKNGEVISGFNVLGERRTIDLRTDLPVKSGFSGAALYKYKAFANGNYFHYKDPTVCEHRIFHDSLQSDNMFISRWFLTIR